MKNYICIPCDNQSDRGYNKALKVYRIKNNQLYFVDANYKMNSASWKGYKTEAIVLMSKIVGHKMERYNFKSKNITMEVI